MLTLLRIKDYQRFFDVSYNTARVMLAEDKERVPNGRLTFYQFKKLYGLDDLSFRSFFSSDIVNND